MLSKIAAVLSVVHASDYFGDLRLSIDTSVKEAEDSYTHLVDGAQKDFQNWIEEQEWRGAYTAQDISQADPDMRKTFNEICVEHGYIHDSHEVETQDGYLLNVFRVRDPAAFKEGAPVVFMQHGVTDSADCWIMNYEQTAPAFQLARAGYDVWLGNQRGTKYSMGHKSLNPKKDKHTGSSHSQRWETMMLQLRLTS